MSDDLARELVHYRQQRLQHVSDGNDKEARRVCAVALGRCQSEGVALPQWLYEAVADSLYQVENADLAQLDNDRNALQRLKMVAVVLGNDNKPQERHFREAADRLNADGDPISPGGVKKLWQRHGETLQALLRFRDR